LEFNKTCSVEEDGDVLFVVVVAVASLLLVVEEDGKEMYSSVTSSVSCSNCVDFHRFKFDNVGDILDVDEVICLLLSWVVMILLVERPCDKVENCCVDDECKDDATRVRDDADVTFRCRNVQCSISLFMVEYMSSIAGIVL